MPETGAASTKATNADTAYERSDASLRLLGIIALGLFLTLCAIPGILLLFFPHATMDRPKAPTLTPPAPRLQADPQADLRELRTSEDARLASYGWIDRSQGIVHIPIERAMHDIAANGISDWPGGRR